MDTPDLTNQADPLKDPEFLKQLDILAKTLKIPAHEDPAVVLNSAFHIIQRKYNPNQNPVLEAKKARALLKDQEAFPLGFDTGDAVVNEAALVLRLLYINDLRNQQTKINEVISLLQSYTANPQTDARLGRVGR